MCLYNTMPPPPSPYLLYACPDKTAKAAKEYKLIWFFFSKFNQVIYSELQLPT